MSERYKKLYHLAHRLYASQAPVLIESGALLLEQRTNAMLCQLCFLNIQDRPIKSLRARVQMLDAEGAPLGRVVDHRYLDLDLKRGEICGRDSAIVLPSEQAASFTVGVTQVSFADGEIWADEEALWTELPDRQPLSQAYEDPALVERFVRRFGSGSLYLPQRTEELWFCTCGAVNLMQDSRCYRCRRRRSALLGSEAEAVSPEELEEGGFLTRLGNAAPLPKPKRRLLLGTCGLVLLALLAVLLLPRLPFRSQAAETAPLPTAGASLPASEEAAAEAAAEIPAAPAPVPDPAEDPRAADYAQAQDLEQKASRAAPEDAPGLYQAAAEAYEALDDYDDSALRAESCRQALETLRLDGLRSEYEDAAALLESGHYSEARAAFLALDDYEDSAEQALEASFRKGQALFLYLDGHSLQGVTASLSMEVGEESLVSLPREQLLRLGGSGVEELRACFGEDPVRFLAGEDPDRPQQMLEDAAADLLRGLGDYRSSSEMAAMLPDMVDRSYEFYALCAAGDLEGARDWLNAWRKPFADRELWMEWLELYLPFCGEWQFRTGDPSLVPSIGEIYEKPDSIRCLVKLSAEEVTLCFLLNEGDSDGPKLYASPGETRFISGMDWIQYFAQLSSSGSLTVNKLQDGGNIGGVEYTR